MTFACSTLSLYLQLRVPDSMITRELDDLIDPFVRWNIKFVLLCQLTTILISPSLVSFSLMGKKGKRSKDILWHKPPSKPVPPFEPLHPLFRGCQTNKHLWLKCLYHLPPPLIIPLRPKRLRTIRHWPPWRNIHRNDRDLLEYACDRFQHLIKRFPQWRLERKPKNGVENDVGFSELGLERVDVFEDWDIEIFALFDKTLQEVFGRGFGEVDSWGIFKMVQVSCRHKPVPTLQQSNMVSRTKCDTKSEVDHAYLVTRSTSNHHTLMVRRWVTLRQSLGAWEACKLHQLQWGVRHANLPFSAYHTEPQFIYPRSNEIERQEGMRRHTWSRENAPEADMSSTSI